eukprot:SAG22_NODE_1469_length_4347_cov_2.842279_3_plen_229_part_00
MKALGQEADEEELARMIAMADADGNGDIDFNEFLSIMTAKLHGGGGGGGDQAAAMESLQAAKQAYWALQSYKYKKKTEGGGEEGGGYGGGSSEWVCIAELQDLLGRDEIDEETPVFTERFSGYTALAKVSEKHPDFEGAISADYYQTLIYVDAATQEESAELDAPAIRQAIRAGELHDLHMCWTAGACAQTSNSCAHSCTHSGPVHPIQCYCHTAVVLGSRLLFAYSC